MDDMTTRQVNWETLDDLVPDEFDKYWELTLNFLKLHPRGNGRRSLPKKAASSRPSAATKLIEAEAARLANTPRSGDCRRLHRLDPGDRDAACNDRELPHGAVVLPGLDMDLDDATWATIADGTESAHGHPQFALAALLKRIGIVRAGVETLAAPHGRERYRLGSVAAGR